jgi:hypothetical protein
MAEIPKTEVIVTFHCPYCWDQQGPRAMYAGECSTCGQSYDKPVRVPSPVCEMVDRPATVEMQAYAEKISDIWRGNIKR